MSIAKTFQNMRDEVGHIAAESSPGQFFDNIRDEAINNSQIQIFNIGVQTFEDIFVRKCKTTLWPGVGVYSLRSLPYEWAKIRYVEIEDTAGIKTPIIPIDLDEKDEIAGNLSPSANRGQPCHFWIEGMLMYVTPTPITQMVLRIYYVRCPSKLINATDVSIIPANHHELVVYGGVIRLRHKDEETIAMYKDHYKDLKKEYIDSLSERQIMFPRYIKDYDYDYLFNNSLGYTW